jgi:hypothetical protein
MSEIIPELVANAVIIIDSRAWTFERVDGNTGFARSDTGKLCVFDAREVRVLGSGLLCLPGRVEAITPSSTVTTDVAVSTSGLALL